MPTGHFFWHPFSVGDAPRCQRRSPNTFQRRTNTTARAEETGIDQPLKNDPREYVWVRGHQEASGPLDYLRTHRSEHRSLRIAQQGAVPSQMPSPAQKKLPPAETGATAEHALPACAAGLR